MALTLEVTNNEEVEVGRLGYVFAPGKTETIEGVTSFRANEVTECKYLTVLVVSADHPNEVPPGTEYKVNATQKAKDLAKEKGINILQVPGTGVDGNVTVDDVRAYEKHVEPAGEADLQDEARASVSTKDSKEKQMEAEAANAAAIRERDNALRTELNANPPGETAKGDQTSDASGDSVGPQAGDVASRQSEHGREVTP